MPGEPVNLSIAIPQSAFVEPAEQVLLACARAGDSSAFESLVAPYRTRILRLAQRILRNHEDAEDAVQTALLEAFRHLDIFEGRSKFSSWLTTIVTNAALMRLRGSRQRYETSLDQLTQGGEDGPVRFHAVEPRPDPEQSCSLKELRNVLAVAMNQLGPRYKRVFYLRHVEELSIKETAGALGISATAVKARMHRARMKVSRSAQSILAGGF